MLRHRLPAGPPASAGVSAHPRYARTFAAALIVLALGIRIAEVQRTAYRPIGDARSYLSLASQIAHTGDYGDKDAGAGGSRGPTAYFSPGYPYFLAFTELIDGHESAGAAAVGPARVTSALLGTAIVVLIGLIALECFGESVALIALGLAAVYPVLVETSALIVVENLQTALELAAVWCALRAQASHSSGWPLAIGALIGLGALTHTDAILLALPLGVALARLPGFGAPRRTGPLMMLGALAVTIAPWVIRDAVVMHTFVPITDETGLTLAGTYNPVSARASDPAYKWLYYTQIRSDDDIAAAAHRLTETQLDSRLESRALSYIGAHPAAPLDVAYHNTLRLLELEGSHAWRASAATIGLSGGTARIGVLGFWVLCALALGGAFTAIVRRVPRWVWAVPLLMALSAVIVNAETPRFREPIDPFLILLAACALANFFRVPATAPMPARRPANESDPEAA